MGNRNIMINEKKHYFFVGIGGIGMGSIAMLLLQKGIRVSGSDIQDNNMLDSVRKKRGTVYIGHDSNNVIDVDVMVYSSAIDIENNPEIQFAYMNGIKMYQRAELLAELMDKQFSITVSGSHGKTTTTAMITHLLQDNNVLFTSVIGGILNGGVFNTGLGRGRYFVAELDESDGSFLNFHPKVSVITNIDLEHLDYYKDWGAIERIYEKFIGNTDANGQVLIYGDDARLKKIVGRSNKGHQTYGLMLDNDLYAKDIRCDRFQTQFFCVYNGNNLGKITIPTIGQHNVLNSLACILVGLTLCIPFRDIAKSMVTFQGVQRRFQHKGTLNDVLVIDDYAHHPTEIINAVKTARSIRQGRLVVIFQPHRYSRFNGLFQEFCEAFDGVDYLIVTDVYSAGEPLEDKTSIEKLIKKIGTSSKTSVEYKDRLALSQFIVSFVHPQDIVMTLGAGDITKVSDDLIKGLSLEDIEKREKDDRCRIR